MIGTAKITLASTGAAADEYATDGDVSATIQGYAIQGSWGTAVLRIEGSNDRSSWTDTGVTLSAPGISLAASIAAYAYVRVYVQTAQAGAAAAVTMTTFTTEGYATIPLALSDLSASGASNGDVITLVGGVWAADTPAPGGGVFSDTKQVTLTGNSGSATISNASITTTSIITASIVGVAKSGTGSEDHIAEELKVYTTNQINGAVDVVILSPHFYSTNTYQVNIIGV